MMEKVQSGLRVTTGFLLMFWQVYRARGLDTEAILQRWRDWKG